MGCSCCNTIEYSINSPSFEKIKEKMYAEYTTYLSFLNTIKNDMNSTINNYKDINNKELNNINNTIINKEFHLIPIDWFENWEKRIEYMINNNKFKPFECNFEYKNLDDKPKFYFEFITYELYSKLYKNKIYDIKTKTKLKSGLICNNLIIFQYTNKSNSIEIFFFEKDEDLFFTNLLFSFEKCDDEQAECIYLLNLLKNSPIHEIFGNMHYDYSKSKFVEQKTNIIIYNKTRKVPEEIKKFRKEQYEKLFRYSLYKEKENESMNNRYNNQEKEIENYIDLEKNNKYLFNNKLNRKNDDNSLIPNSISRASTIMMGNSQNMMKNNLSNNISRIKIYKQKDFIQESYNQDDNGVHNNENNDLTITPVKNNITTRNRLPYTESKKNTKNLILNNNGELSTIIDNKFKRTSLLDSIEENKISENLFNSVLYCLFNIKELTEYIINNVKNNIINYSKNSFYYNYIKIVEFLYHNNNNNNVKPNNIYEMSNNEKNLIKNCPDYNFSNLSDLIFYRDGFNIISKILNGLHLELNTSTKKERLKYTNSITKENENKKNSIKNLKYNQFIEESKESNSSIIYDLFYGIKEIKTICNSCNKINYEYNIMNILELSRDNIINYYKSIKNNNKTIITIEDCLNYYKKEEKQSEKALFNCPFCNDFQDFIVYNDIHKYPQIFIIYFNYDNINFVENGEELNISINEKIDILKDKYELIGIISIKNKNENNGEYKYIAYSHNFLNENWVMYDEYENKIETINLNDILRKIHPLSLFYKKIESK